MLKRDNYRIMYLVGGLGETLGRSSVFLSVGVVQAAEGIIRGVLGRGVHDVAVE